MAGINLIKNFKALISITVPLDAVPTNGKLKFGNKNNDSGSKYSNTSANNNNNNE